MKVKNIAFAAFLAVLSAGCAKTEEDLELTPVAPTSIQGDCKGRCKFRAS